MIMPYIEHIGAVVQVQSHVRGFLARKRFAALKEENDEIDREVASRVIQRNFRLYLFRKRNIHAARIARFIRRLPALRDRRLRKIRDNLRRIAVREASGAGYGETGMSTCLDSLRRFSARQASAYARSLTT